MALWRYEIKDWVLKRADEKQQKMMKTAAKKCEFFESLSPNGPDTLSFHSTNKKKKRVSFDIARRPAADGIFKIKGPDNQEYEGRMEQNRALFSIESTDDSFRLELRIVDIFVFRNQTSPFSR